VATNNEAENCAKSEKGGESAAILMTLVTTAMANGVYPGLYIKELLKNIGTDRTDFSKYMPWSPWMREEIEYKK
jgi:hypothetical protein